jgi:predicted RNA-binding protein (virulence factor B family)
MQNNEIKYLYVADKTDEGTLLEISETETILLPLSEQIKESSIGEECLVIIRYDENSEEYFASEKIEDFLSNDEINESLKEGDLVKGIVYKFTPLGSKVAFNSKFTGLLYTTETFSDLTLGDEVEVYIKKIREDGKVDLSMEKGGYKNFINEYTQKIVELLKESDGFLPFSDKSTPEDIYEQFSMSKKRFKESIGALYRDKVISIEDGGIRLN